VSNRRRLIVALGAAALALPLTPHAQPVTKVRRIGILYPGSQSDSNDLANEFLKALRELGRVEGTDFVIEWRYADGKTEPLAALAAELVKQNVDVIVTEGTSGVRAARQATTTIPIVTASFADPVGGGFAASLAHPGGNITGLSNLGEEVISKRMELLVSVAPKATRIAYLMNPNNPVSTRMSAILESTARKLGKAYLRVEARAAGELVDAFSRMARERVGALMVQEEATLNPLGAQIAGLALRQKLPSIFGVRKIAEAGGLMSYGADYGVRFRRAAIYVDKILKGAKAGDLPIEQPREFELVVNLVTAKALGIRIPQSILVSATKVIE
jgi:putative ABC transport system substrate-binding protein